MNDITTVAIVGGTHGNELTGVHLLKHWEVSSNEIRRETFNTELVLANPKANAAMKRYLDQDLNRQFSVSDLSNPNLSGYEQCRAKSLNLQLGPKEQPRVDFILDLHTTTANMGVTLVLNTDDPFVMRMAFYIKQKMPDATLFFHPTERMEDNFLMSMARLNGLLIEVGPIPQGLLNHQVYEQTRQATLHALDFIELYNNAEEIVLPDTFPAYQFIKKVKLPENQEGEITAMVHPERQNQDYALIKTGDPLFITLDGNTINYEEKENVYGAFINEAAYYDQYVGLSFMRKIELSVSSAG